MSIAQAVAAAFPTRKLPKATQHTAVDATTKIVPVKTPAQGH